MMKTIQWADNHIKDLLKRGSYYLFKSGSDKNDLDMPFPFFFLLNWKQTKAKTFIFRMQRWQHLADTTCKLMMRQKANAVLPKLWNWRKANNPFVLFRALANRGSNAGFNDVKRKKI